MSDEVFVPYGDSAQETATLLLAAVEEEGAEPAVVRSSSDGGFYVPEALAQKANVDYQSEDGSVVPAKKAAAKKTAAKK